MWPAKHAPDGIVLRGVAQHPKGTGRHVNIVVAWRVGGITVREKRSSHREGSARPCAPSPTVKPSCEFTSSCAHAVARVSWQARVHAWRPRALRAHQVHHLAQLAAGPERRVALVVLRGRWKEGEHARVVFQQRSGLLGAMHRRRQHDALAAAAAAPAVSGGGLGARSLGRGARRAVVGRGVIHPHGQRDRQPRAALRGGVHDHAAAQHLRQAARHMQAQAARAAALRARTRRA